MDLKAIIAALDSNILRLQRARFALLYDEEFAKPKPKRRKKRNLTPEGRARIAEAVRNRWSVQKTAKRKATKQGF